MSYKKKQEEYTKYIPSVDVTNAKKARDSALANDPRKDSQFGALSKEYLDQYLNRKAFTYDANIDPLYKQYAEVSKRNGETAMRDTMGAATALSGGYANSYAQTAGQGAYNQYMTALNDKIPELYALAYDRYNAEGNDLLTKYNLLYNNDRQALSDYYTEADFRNNLYQQEYGNEYATFGDERSYINNLAAQEREDYWNAQQLAEEQRQYNASLAEEQRQYDANLAEDQRRYDASLVAEANDVDYDELTPKIVEEVREIFNARGAAGLDEWLYLYEDKYSEEDIEKLISALTNGKLQDWASAIPFLNQP